MDRLDPAIPRQECVESTAKGKLVPLGRGAEAHPLTDSVNPGVGAAGRMGQGPPLEEAVEYALELGLDRAARRLPLPPDKAGAVVV